MTKNISTHTTYFICLFFILHHFTFEYVGKSSEVFFSFKWNNHFFPFILFSFSWLASFCLSFICKDLFLWQWLTPYIHRNDGNYTKVRKFFLIVEFVLWYCHIHTDIGRCETCNGNTITWDHLTLCSVATPFFIEFTKKRRNKYEMIHLSCLRYISGKQKNERMSLNAKENGLLQSKVQRFSLLTWKLWFAVIILQINSLKSARPSL